MVKTHKIGINTAGVVKICEGTYVISSSIIKDDCIINIDVEGNVIIDGAIKCGNLLIDEAHCNVTVNGSIKVDTLLVLCNDLKCNKSITVSEDCSIYCSHEVHCSMLYVEGNMRIRCQALYTRVSTYIRGGFQWISQR